MTIARSKFKFEGILRRTANATAEREREGEGEREGEEEGEREGGRRMRYLAGFQRGPESHVLWIRDSTLFVPNKGGFTADSDKALRFSDANMARLAVAPSASTRDSIVILPVNE